MIYRYLLKSVYDGEVSGYAKFAAVSVIVIAMLFRCKAAESGQCSFADCSEIAKNYSKETEYCEENMEMLIENFRTKAFFSSDSLKNILSYTFDCNVGVI
jgi:lysine-N-methylase